MPSAETIFISALVARSKRFDGVIVQGRERVATLDVAKTIAQDPGGVGVRAEDRAVLQHHAQRHRDLYHVLVLRLIVNDQHAKDAPTGLLVHQQLDHLARRWRRNRIAAHRPIAEILGFTRLDRPVGFGRCRGGTLRRRRARENGNRRKAGNETSEPKTDRLHDHNLRHQDLRFASLLRNALRAST